MKVNLNIYFESTNEFKLLAKAIDTLPFTCEVTHSHTTPSTAAPAKDKPLTSNQKLAAKLEKSVVKEAGEAAPVTDKGQDTESGAPEADYKSMKEAVLLLNRVKGREATEAILKKYDWEKNGKLTVGPHIPEKHFADIIAEINDILAKA